MTSPRQFGRALFLLLAVAGFELAALAQSVDDELARFIASKPHPVSVSEFRPLAHLAPQNQDTTNICWSFATSSFIESEMSRLGREPIRLSVMYSVYNTYIEKARRFVETKGMSRFSPGDLFSGVWETARAYGMMPAASYEGLKKPGMAYNHDPLDSELGRVIDGVKAAETWDEKAVLERVKTVLNAHLGAPPARFQFKGKEYTPLSFASEVVGLPWDEYVQVTSFSSAPYNAFVPLRVPDNWAQRSNFLNVPLDQFYASFRQAVASGYTVAIDMDNAEPSYRRTKQYGVILPSDVREDSIDQTAREARFQDGRTTDEHLMHTVSYKKFGEEDWFLVKDSWRTAFEGPNGGYFFFNEAYVKLKVLAYLVHRDALPGIGTPPREN